MFEVEGHNSLVVHRKSKRVEMAQRAAGIVVACAPMSLHAGPGELVILRMTFVVSGVVYEMDNIVILAFGIGAQKFGVLAPLKVFGQLFQQGSHGVAHALRIFEIIRARPRSTRILNLLAARLDLANVAG